MKIKFLTTCFLVMSLAGWGSNALAVWDIETVDSGGDVGWYSSLALDGGNLPHISYYDYTNTNLKYAVHNGTSWQITTVDNSGSVGEFTSLALDAANHPHISYDASGLKYARWTGSAWELTTSGLGSSVSFSTSLALGTDGTRHISHGELRYARYNGSSWTTVFLTSDGSPMESALALDSSNVAHIAYSGNANDVYYGLVNGTTWNAAGPPSTGDNDGYWPSLDIAGDGSRHISYWSWTSSALDYRRHNGSGWEAVQTVDSDGDVGWYSSLAVDNTGASHISYHDHTNWDLKYATNSSGSWVAQTVDAPGGIGYSTSLTLDTGDNPHMTYYDVSYHDLKYARWIPGPYAIQGTIRDGSSTPMAGVYVFLSGNNIESNFLTASDGAYSFSGIPTGNYSVTPMLAGWMFSPTQRSYASLNQNHTGEDFTMIPGTGYFIRGYVMDAQGFALDNVLVTLAGDTQGSYTTNATGYYEFINIAAGGNYNVTPTLSGYAFTPQSLDYTALSADQDSQDFSGVQASTYFSLAGTVRDSNGNGVADAQVDLIGTNIITNPGTTVTAQALTPGSGDYRFDNLYPGDYHVQVSKSGWTFIPDERLYQRLLAGQSAQDFTGIFQASLPGPDEIRVVGNLFNPIRNEYTTAWFTLAQAGQVRLRLYSLDGVLVKTLIDETRHPGLHSIRWYGRNQNGQFVASGIYFLDIQIPGHRKMIKLCVIK